MQAAHETAAVTDDLLDIGRRCQGLHAGRAREPDVGQLDRLAVAVDEAFCCRVADRHEHAPGLAYDASLAARYERTKAEVRWLYDEVVAAGVVVEPWVAPGSPYRDSRQLADEVRATRTLRLLLTRDAHGPSADKGYHPLREPSDVVAGGVELVHNDLMRAVHDLFGHVMVAAGFGPAGELKAAYAHMALHSDDVQAVLFVEQVAQICWFYFGPLVRDGSGRVRRRGDRDYIERRHRPYAEQKVYPAASEDLQAFRRMFRVEDAA